MKRKKKHLFYFKKIKALKTIIAVGSIVLLGILFLYLIKIPTYILIFKHQKCIGKIKIEDSKVFYVFDDGNGSVFGVFVSNTDCSLKTAGEYFKKEKENVGTSTSGTE